MKWSSHILMAVTWLAILTNLTSCGYTTSSRGRQFVGGYKLVSVPIFKNRSQEPKIEVYFTNALKEELFRDKMAEVSEKELAPITIEGTVNSVSFSGSGPTTNGSITALPNNAVLMSSYGVNVSTTITVRRNADKKIIWSGTFTNGRSYRAPQIGTESINSANVLYNQSARLQNVQVLAEIMMREAYNRMTESF